MGWEYERRTIILDILMEEGDDTRCNVIGEVDGLRPCLIGHLGNLLQVSKQKAVGVAGETLVSQGPLQRLWPHPRPSQHSPC
uniref:Birch protein n=1 Tax=Betula platyphylla TaxID=78630 RepID=A0A9E9L825_BETPL|nr:birch protein [Betula platyphylla]